MSTFQREVPHDSDDGNGTEEGPSAIDATLFNLTAKGRLNEINEQGDPRRLLENVTWDQKWMQFKPPN